MSFFQRLKTRLTTLPNYNLIKDYTRDSYTFICIYLQLLGLYTLSEYYLCKIVGVNGPSMLPTIDTRDNLVLVDSFTTRFLRQPRKGEIILAENPFKPGHTIVKRVLYIAGERAEVLEPRTQ